MIQKRLTDLISDTSSIKEYLGVSSQAINQYRNGASIPTIEKLCKIAEFYQTSVDYIVGRTNAKFKKSPAVDELGISEKSIETIKSMSDKEKKALSIALEAVGNLND